jgi:hypothetical protein
MLKKNLYGLKTGAIAGAFFAAVTPYVSSQDQACTEHLWTCDSHLTVIDSNVRDYHTEHEPANGAPITISPQPAVMGISAGPPGGWDGYIGGH